LSLVLNEDSRRRTAQYFRLPTEGMMDHVTGLIHFSLTLGKEALELLDEL
jgi:hypothetical protein